MSLTLEDGRVRIALMSIYDVAVWACSDFVRATTTLSVNFHGLWVPYLLGSSRQRVLTDICCCTSITMSSFVQFWPGLLACVYCDFRAYQVSLRT